MAGPSIKVKVDDKPFTSMKEKLAAARKEYKAYEKELDALNKKCEKVSDELKERLSHAAQTVQQHEKILKDQGKAFQNQERFNNRKKANKEGFNVPGMLRDKVEESLANAKSPWLRKAGKFAFGEMGSTAPSGLAKVGQTAAVIYGGAKLTQIAMNLGSGDTDDMRQARRDFAINMTEASNKTPEKQALLKEEMARKAREAKYEAFGFANGIPILGDLVQGIGNRLKSAEGFFRNQRYDVTAKLQTRADLKDSNLGGVINEGALRRLAEERVLRDEYGSDLGGAIGADFQALRRKLGVSDEEIEKKITASAAASLAKYTELNAKGMDRIRMNDFSGAEIAFRNAAQELGLSNWKNPLTVWHQNENADKANIAYVQSQMRLPPVRKGM